MRLAGELGGDDVDDDRAERGPDQRHADEVGQDQHDRANGAAGQHGEDRRPGRRRADDGGGDQGSRDEAVDAEHDAEQPLADEARQQASAEQEHGGRELVDGGEHGPIIDGAPPRPASENAS